MDNSTLSVSLAQTYLHVGNGGVNIAVLDGSEGPTLQVILSTFGHPATTTVYTSVEAIREVGEMLLSVANSDHQWQKPYCNHARLTHSRRYGQDEVSFVKTSSGESFPEDDDKDSEDTSKDTPMGKSSKPSFEDRRVVLEARATKAVEVACATAGIAYASGMGISKEIEDAALVLMDMPGTLDQLHSLVKKPTLNG